jgi:hypothetical protein
MTLGPQETQPPHLMPSISWAGLDGACVPSRAGNLCLPLPLKQKGLARGTKFSRRSLGSLQISSKLCGAQLECAELAPHKVTGKIFGWFRKPQPQRLPCDGPAMPPVPAPRMPQWALPRSGQ